MYIKKGRPTVPRATVPCTGCGALVTRYASALATLKTGRTFCSKECRNRIGCKPRRGIEKPCLVCRKVFYVAQCFKDQKYCSKECHDASQTKPKVYRSCEVCGKEMALKPSQAAGSFGRFCGIECRGIGRTTRHAGFDYNGRPAVIDHFGYVRVWQPDHPKAGHGRVQYHRIIVEQALGRYLKTEEQVDHINRVKTDNRLENLQLLSASDHGIKTNGDRLREVQEARAAMAELEEYRKRFGPLA